MKLKLGLVLTVDTQHQFSIVPFLKEIIRDIFTSEFVLSKVY